MTYHTALGCYRKEDRLDPDSTIRLCKYYCKVMYTEELRHDYHDIIGQSYAHISPRRICGDEDVKK